MEPFLHQLAANLRGEQVAARITDDNAEHDEWLVLTVTHFDRATEVFHLQEDDPINVQEAFVLPISQIIPFPKDRLSAPELPQGNQVLALYPGTTALYSATVVSSHLENQTDNYVLVFDDDEEDGLLPQRIVRFDRVVELPAGYRL